MRAIEITIHNFRSIVESTIRLSDLSIIAGANNSGKSNFIDAIRLFYGDVKFTSHDIPKTKTIDNETWVEIEFQPSETELTQLKDDYRTPSGTFRVRNYFRSSVLDSDGKARAGIYAYVDNKLSESLFYGAKNVGSGKFGKIVFIPAVSKLDDHTKLTGPSHLRDLVTNVLSKVVRGSQAYGALESAFADFKSAIRIQPTSAGHSLATLESDISDELASWNTTFKFDIQSVDPDDLIKSLVKHHLIDDAHGELIDQLRFGAGFQRNLIFVLIKLAAKYSNVAAKPATKKEFSPELTWILFEEPEAFLHPSQEDVLYANLRTIAEEASSQVLLSTHSARMVSSSMDDLTRLVKLRRDHGNTAAFQLSPTQLAEYFNHVYLSDAEICPEIFDAATVDKELLMSAMKLEVWLQPHRSSAFFAQSVLLVEGPSEVGLCSYLVKHRLTNSLPPDLVVLDCLGKFNLHRFMRLLNTFGVHHSVLYDGDNGGRQDKEVGAAIDNARGPFTRKIKRFDANLETELGIPPLGKKDSHRKPQHVLYHLAARKIDDERVQAFSTMVNELCS